MVEKKEISQEEQIRLNAACLIAEIEWFISVLNHRLLYYFPLQKVETSPVEATIPTKPQKAGWGSRLLSIFVRNQKNQTETLPKAEEAKEPVVEVSIPAPKEVPDLSQTDASYASFIQENGLTPDERLVLILCLIPYLCPEYLDVFFMQNPSTGRGYAEFGGLKGTRHGGFLPTIETAIFLVAGSELDKRIFTQKFFEPEHTFMKKNILQIGQSQEGEPYYSRFLSMDKDLVDYFTLGVYQKPQFSTDFPAKPIQTAMNWDDLILDSNTHRQLNEIHIWLEHHQTLLNNPSLKKIIKPGYKALFYGPSGTGKTLAASLLGKSHGLDVYRIDLSTIVSKYIGETEKNLEKVFNKATHKNWILFFDEADALFGKRTNISDAHDKYANQEVSYLLQRLEDYPGLVILASNMKQNLDEAFCRRLQAMVMFPKPQAAERLQIWKNGFGDIKLLAEDVNLEEIARQYELTGGNIINVIQYAYLMMLHRKDTLIQAQDIKDGIRKEFLKEGKTL